MVHTLVTVRGAEILTVVNFVPGFSEQSELFHYINKLLRVSVRFIMYLIGKAAGKKRGESRFGFQMYVL